MHPSNLALMEEWKEESCRGKKTTRSLVAVFTRMGHGRVVLWSNERTFMNEDPNPDENLS